MAEEIQNETNPHKQGSVNSSAIIIIGIIVIIGAIIAGIVFFRNKIKSAFSKKDDTSQVQDQASTSDNLNDSSVNELDGIARMGENQNDTEEPQKEESITLPEETVEKIVRQ